MEREIEKVLADWAEHKITMNEAKRKLLNLYTSLLKEETLPCKSCGSKNTDYDRVVCFDCGTYEYYY